MIGLVVELNKEDLARWTKGVRGIQNSAHWWLKANGGELNRMLSSSYSSKVIANILSKKWSFMPYVQRYSDWKAKVGLGSQPFWKLKGDLVASINNFQEKGGWVGGIPGSVTDSGGKSWFGKLDKGDSKRIAMIATVLEYGGDYRARKGGYHFPRPVLSNTLDEFEQQNYDGIPDRVMSDIERNWS